MANWFTRVGCVRKAWKPPSSQPILIHFEFRNKPSLITVICLDPHSPNKLFATRYCFLMLGDNTSFFFFIFFFRFFFCYFTLLIIFTKIIILLVYYHYFFFMKIIFIFSFSGIFRDVPGCSGMFRVPGFIDARNLLRSMVFAEITFFPWNSVWMKFPTSSQLMIKTLRISKTYEFLPRMIISYKWGVEFP